MGTIINEDGKPVILPPGTSVGAFVIGKDGDLETRIELFINPSHKKYVHFMNKLRDLIDEYKGDGLIPYMSGV